MPSVVRQWESTTGNCSWCLLDSTLLTLFSVDFNLHSFTVIIPNSEENRFSAFCELFQQIIGCARGLRDPETWEFVSDVKVVLRSPNSVPPEIIFLLNCTKSSIKYFCWEQYYLTSSGGRGEWEERKKLFDFCQLQFSHLCNTNTNVYHTKYLWQLSFYKYVKVLSNKSDIVWM